MSWLNNSINTLKGQITTFAQEVFVEAPQEEDNTTTPDLDETVKKNEELNNLCEAKDNEIALLKKQISDLLVKQNETARRSPKSLLEKNASLEDSWCLEPENIPSDSSSKNDASEETSSGGELITIPLDVQQFHDSSPNDNIEKYHRTIDEKDNRLKKLEKENTTLKDKIHQLTDENRDLNVSLEELDSQQNDAIQNLLAFKNDLQEKCNKNEYEFRTLQEEHKVQLSKNKSLTKELDQLQKKFGNLEKSHTLNVQENEILKNKLSSVEAQVSRYHVENEDLLKMFKFKETELRAIIETAIADKEYLQRENQDLQGQLNELKQDFEKSVENLKKSVKEWEEEKVILETKLSEISSNKAKSEEDFIVLHNEDVERKAQDTQSECSSTDNQSHENCEWKRKYDELVSGQGPIQNEFLIVAEHPSEENIKVSLKKTSHLESNEYQSELEGILEEKSKLEKELSSVKAILFDLEQTAATKRMNEHEGYEENADNVSKEMLITQVGKLEKENAEYKLKADELAESFEKLELNASEMERKLMMENVNLQKQLIDMESSINKSNIAKLGEINTINENIEHIKELFITYFDINLIDKDRISLETDFKMLRDKIWKIDVLEKNLKEMSEEVSHLIQEKSAVEHEKNTLQADIRHYQVECSQLMNNNEILLSELENYKHNKLETINENHEESVTSLERQLEECNNLKMILENEYKELKRKFNGKDTEKETNRRTIEELQGIVSSLKGTVKNLQIQIDSLEAEKCNLIFEINEMKTDDKKSAMDSIIIEYKKRISRLERELATLNKVHEEHKMSAQIMQSSVCEKINDFETLLSKLEKQLNEKNNLLLMRENDIEKLLLEKKSLEALLEGMQHKQNDESETIKIITKLQDQKSVLEHELLTIKNNLQEALRTNEILLKDISKLNEEKLKTDHILDVEKTTLTEKMNFIDRLNKEIKELQEKLNEKSRVDKETTTELLQLRQKVDTLNVEKNDLIMSVTTKHSENMQYYAEIQRLGQLVQEEIEKSKIALLNCENCKKLRDEVSILSSGNGEEVEKLKDRINFLKEKSDILTSNLLSEQTNQKLLRQEIADANETNNNLQRDLERLREHLVELEDGHTQETLEMQRIIDEKHAKLATLEQEMSQSSNAYTSASIRANQHAESLQAQYARLTQQRDDLVAKLSLAEDKESKNQAALVNLQCALEQFQKEKENDIQSATYRIRKQLEIEQENQKKLHNEIASMQQQLSEANQGLLAAARLSDQLEISQVTIAALKEEIHKLEGKNCLLDDKLKLSESNQNDKVEKSLVKSLLIGYLVSNNPNDKSQILKLISSVLDFSQIEINKIGLNKTQGGWLSGILYGGSNSPNDDSHNKDSLARAFVNFLEKESQPRGLTETMPNLLNIVNEKPVPEFSGNAVLTGGGGGAEYSQSSNLTNNNPNPAPIGVHPIFLNDNVLDPFAPTRNSSSILKNILNDS